MPCGYVTHVIGLLAVSGASRGMPTVGAAASANEYEARCAESLRTRSPSSWAGSETILSLLGIPSVSDWKTRSNPDQKSCTSL